MVDRLIDMMGMGAAPQSGTVPIPGEPGHWQVDPNSSPAFYGIGPGYAPQGVASGAPMTLPPDFFSDGGFEQMPAQYWQQYRGDPTTGGGFFTMNDYFDRQPGGAFGAPPAGTIDRGIPAGYPGAVSRKAPGENTPWALQAGANAPSTNNYRLLPQRYQTPDYIMRNGQIINRNMLSQTGDYAAGVPGFSPMGADEGGVVRRPSLPGANVGYPQIVWPGTAFWPGQVGSPAGSASSQG